MVNAETRAWEPGVTGQRADTLPPKQWEAGSGSKMSEDPSLSLLI